MPSVVLQLARLASILNNHTCIHQIMPHNGLAWNESWKRAFQNALFDYSDSKISFVKDVHAYLTAHTQHPDKKKKRGKKKGRKELDIKRHLYVRQSNYFAKGICAKDGRNLSPKKKSSNIGCNVDLMTLLKVWHLILDQLRLKVHYKARCHLVQQLWSPDCLTRNLKYIRQGIL